MQIKAAPQGLSQPCGACTCCPLVRGCQELVAELLLLPYRKHKAQKPNALSSSKHKIESSVLENANLRFRFGKNTRRICDRAEKRFKTRKNVARKPLKHRNFVAGFPSTSRTSAALYKGETHCFASVMRQLKHMRNEILDVAGIVKTKAQN